MKHHPNKRYRQSIRLRGYDYTQAGAYFITICIHRRLCLLGDIADGIMRLDFPGKMIQRWWLETPNKFPSIALDEFVIMPNHLHAIVVLSPSDDSPVGAALRGRPGSPGAPLPRTHPESRAWAEPRGDADRRSPDRPGQRQTGRPHRGAPTNPLALFDVLDWFKTMSTNEYVRGVKESGWPLFDRHLWQRSYHDHIIRNERELDAIRAYILANPSRWALDIDNPIHSLKSAPRRTVDDYLRDAYLL